LLSSKLKVAVGFISSLFIVQTELHAQVLSKQAWEGNWITEGSLFEVGIEIENSVMTISQVESMGFVWTSKSAKVEGSIATVEIEYGGVTGVAQAELVSEDTTVVFPLSCEPNYMVICLLTKDQRVIFRKIKASD
jgi:hypothetical protein